MYIYVENTYALVSRNLFTVECIKDIPCVEEVIYVTSIKEDRSMIGFRFARKKKNIKNVTFWEPHNNRSA